MSAEARAVDERTKVLLLSVRQAIIMMLGALEDYLGLPRSITPRHRKGEG